MNMECVAPAKAGAVFKCAGCPDFSPVFPNKIPLSSLDRKPILPSEFDKGRENNHE